MSEENIQLVRKGYEAFAAGDIEGMLANMSEDIQWETRFLPGIPLHGMFAGHAGVRDFKHRLADAYDVLEFVPTDWFGVENMVVVLGYERVQVKSTGKEVYNEWAHVFEVRNGKVVSFQGSNDVAAVAEGFTF